MIRFEKRLASALTRYFALVLLVVAVASPGSVMAQTTNIFDFENVDIEVAATTVATAIVQDGIALTVEPPSAATGGLVFVNDGFGADPDAGTTGLSSQFLGVNNATVLATVETFTFLVAPGSGLSFTPVSLEFFNFTGPDPFDVTFTGTTVDGEEVTDTLSSPGFTGNVDDFEFDITDRLTSLTFTNDPTVTFFIDNVELTVFSAPGDFNGDIVVNAADFTVFRDNFGGDEALIGGSTTGDGDGVVGLGDFDVFAASFQPESTETAAAFASAVPEPTAFTALLVGLAFTGAARSTRHRGSAA